MTRKQTLLAMAGALALGMVLWMVSPASASLPGMAAADQVSQTSYYDYMNNSLYTHTGQSRRLGGAQHDPARNNIRDLMTAYELNVTLEPFTYSSTTYYNVVGTKVGTTYPTRIYIFGAHFDSTTSGTGPAPGADDNASGVAAVLEAARILTAYDSDCTIKFIAFDREEQGLVGSEAYVAAHGAEDIRGMIAADMIAYDPGTNNSNIYGRTASNPIKNSLAAAVAEYGAGLQYTIGGDEPYSDHAPFEADGFQACLLIEKNVWTNPYYHTSQDSFEQSGNLNFPYAVKMTRSVVGWLVDAAGVHVPYNGLDFVYPNGLPEMSSPAGGTTVRVEVVGMGTAVPQPGTGRLYYNTGSGWQNTLMTQITPNVYDAILPGDTCGDVVSYYFSAEAVGGQAFLDPPSAPAQLFTTTAAYDIVTIYENNFDTNPGWAISGGQWAFGHPTGGGSYNHDPSNGHTGTNVYGYNLSGDYANSIPVYYLTSSAINCTGAYGTTLEFWRWLGVESNNNYDKATIEVSGNNGSTWTVIWRAYDTGGAVSDSAWTFQSFNISAYADNKSAVKIRWGMGPTDTNLTYPGWNIDDLRITALDCTAPPTGACCFPDGSCMVTLPGECTGDYLGDLTVCDPNPCPPPTGACCDADGSCAVTTQADCTGVYQGDFTSCDPNPCIPPVCRGDCNCDHAVGFADIDLFVAAIPNNQTNWSAKYQAFYGVPAPAWCWENCDVNGNGNVGFDDIDQFVAKIPSACPN